MIAMPKLHHLRTLALCFLVLFALAGCTTLSSTGFGTIAGQQDQGPSVPSSETLGDGDMLVGILIARGQRGFPDGAANSVHLAARLAAANPAAAGMKFEVRTIAADSSAIRRAADAMRQAGAQLIIADLDAAGTLAASGSGIPVISLARAATAHADVYWAGLNDLDEAAALVRAAQARNITSLGIVVTADPQSQALAAAIATVAPQLGIRVSTLQAQTAQSLLDYVAATEGGDRVDALVFATPAYIAVALAQPVLETYGTMPVAVVGNASWAFSDAPLSALAPGWYPSLPTTGLSAYRDRFRTAFGVSPTLRSALAYDIMILAAALPTLVEHAPYDRAILTNNQGFQGFAGAFRFETSGSTAQRRYDIVELR